MFNCHPVLDKLSSIHGIICNAQKSYREGCSYWIADQVGRFPADGALPIAILCRGTLWFATLSQKSIYHIDMATMFREWPER